MISKSKFTRLAFLLTVSSALAVEGLSQDNFGFSVQTKIEHGLVEGVYDTRSGLSQYFGIPFAKAPIGDLRWKAPQPLESWTGVRAAKSFGPRPVQGVVFGDMNSRSAGLSEDCLYLNVWTPAKRNVSKLPVLVYFFGGGFVAGDGSEPRYDGGSMAKKGIVVVTVNYRLNIFGFFAHPELSKESPYHASGNYGLLDQHAALQWVQKNIATFGGDPKRVTIAGESAGSIAVSALMSSPLSKKLIAGAIGESGAVNQSNASACSTRRSGEDGLRCCKERGICYAFSIESAFYKGNF
ncbi:MAG: carboxylesterase family protein [Chryseolinea sp.]